MSEPGVYRHGTCAIDWSGLTAVVWCEQCGWVGSVPSLSMDGARDAVTQHDYFTHDAKTLSQTYKVTKRKTGLTRQSGRMQHRRVRAQAGIASGLVRHALETMAATRQHRRCT